MSALADPWVGYEGDVKQSVEEFRSSFGKFEALQRDGRPDEVQHAQKELLSQLKTLNWCDLPFCPARSSSGPATAVPRPPRRLLSQRELPLRRDMDDLSDAIKAVEKNRAKYKLDDVELQRRRSAPLPPPPRPRPSRAAALPRPRSARASPWPAAGLAHQPLMVCAEISSPRRGPRSGR